MILYLKEWQRSRRRESPQWYLWWRNRSFKDKGHSEKVGLYNRTRPRNRFREGRFIPNSGLSILINEKILEKPEYLGQYGTIKRIVVNKNNAYNSGVNGPSYSAYVTYSTENEASTAILVNCFLWKFHWNMISRLTNSISITEWYGPHTERLSTFCLVLFSFLSGHI